MLFEPIHCPAKFKYVSGKYVSYVSFSWGELNPAISAVRFCGVSSSLDFFLQLEQKSYFFLANGTQILLISKKSKKNNFSCKIWICIPRSPELFASFCRNRLKKLSWSNREFCRQWRAWRRGWERCEMTRRKWWWHLLNWLRPTEYRLNKTTMLVKWTTTKSEAKGSSLVQEPVTIYIFSFC